MEANIDFTVEIIETETEQRDNRIVQEGCWGDTGSGAYC